MTILNEEDSAKLLADLANGCSVEEADRRTFNAAVHLNKVLVGHEAKMLCASPIACAAADIYCAMQCQYKRQAAASYPPEGPVAEMGSNERAAFSALELATRESPLRKVKP